MEFSFGHTDAALAALKESLELSPRNAQALALKGFVVSAQNKIAEARGYFERAIAADGSLANGWLGRGLVRIKAADVNDGRQDLETAAALEPNRAFLRSYLGKAWSLDKPFQLCLEHPSGHERTRAWPSTWTPTIRPPGFIPPCSTTSAIASTRPSRTWSIPRT